MEKFLCFLKLSKASILIGWFKLSISVILICFILTGLSFSSSIEKILKTEFQVKNTNPESQSTFYLTGICAIFVLLIYSAVSFILIIGSINHDRINVVCYLVIDATVTIIVSYVFYLKFFNFIYLLIVAVQFYLIYTVFSYFVQLLKESRNREENREKRNRHPLNLGFIRTTQRNIEVSEDF